MPENPLDVAAVEADRQRIAESRASTLETQQAILDGIAAIQSARDAAQADVAVVDNLKAQADTLSAAITARLTTVAAFTPAATYDPAQLAAVKGEVVWLLKQLKTLTDATAEMYNWRRAVDQNAVLTDASLIGLARLAQGDAQA